MKLFFALFLLSANAMATYHAVGINTISPQSYFDVAGSAAFGTYGGVTAAPTNSVIVGGNVGIGTSSPSAPLYVAGNVATTGDIYNPTSGNIAELVLAGDSTASTQTSSIALWGQGNPTYPGQVHIISEGASGAIRFFNYTSSSGWVESMHISNLGFVGIGTTAPGAPLQVNNSTNYSQVVFGDNYGSTSNLGSLSFQNYSDGNNYIDTKTKTSGNTYYRTGQGTETGFARTWMTVAASNGYVDFAYNVGIGTTSPGSQLDVIGNGRFTSPNSGTTGAVVIRDASGNPDAAILQFVNNAVSSQYSWIRGDTNGTTYFSGNVSASNVSDMRLKKNIATLSDGEGLAELEKLRPVSFEWKNPAIHAAGRAIGFIAQEVQKAFPAWVHEISVTEADKKLLPKDQKPLGIDQFPAGFDALVVKAIQELHSEIAKLRQQDVAKDQQIEQLKTYLCHKDPSAGFCH